MKYDWIYVKYLLLNTDLGYVYIQYLLNGVGLQLTTNPTQPTQLLALGKWDYSLSGWLGWK